MTEERKKTIVNLVLCLVTIILTGFIFCSCQKDDEEECVPPVEHVLFVYMGGDNNLSDETYQKIEAIRKGWDGDVRRKIVIYNDPQKGTPTLTEIAKENGQNIQKVIRQYEEENSASSTVIERVIRDVKSLYPSPSYGMLIFSHASGWLPKGMLLRPKSIMVDGADEMELADLVAALPDKGFEYIVFETCFSAGIEVLYALKDKADYILASSAEIVSPGFTDVYPDAINDLLDKDLQSFAKKAHNHIEQKQGARQSSTLSIVKTSALEPLAAYIMKNCDISLQVQINDIQRFDRYSYRLFFDFKDYYSRLLETDEQKEELSQLIDNCILWKAATKQFLVGDNGFNIKEYSGMTTYIMQEQYPIMNMAYCELSWSRDIRDILGGKDAQFMEILEAKIPQGGGSIKIRSKDNHFSIGYIEYVSGNEIIKEIIRMTDLEIQNQCIKREWFQIDFKITPQGYISNVEPLNITFEPLSGKISNRKLIIVVSSGNYRNTITINQD